MEDKRSLRTRLRDARARRSPADVEAAAVALAERGVSAVGDAKTVAAYASIRDEPPTQLLLDELRRRDVQVLLPRVAEGDLEWAPYESWAALAMTDRGLREPTGPAIAASLADIAEVVLAPALAVDRRGNRLGRGAGYYDRALAAVSHDRVIAVVFEDEVLDSLPADAYDVPVATALTPSGLVSLSGD